jgi:4-hydroxybenzoate polyprenyltransferase
MHCFKEEVFLEKVVTTHNNQQAAHENNPNLPATPGTPPDLTGQGTWDKLRALFKSFRPRQWTKNFAVFVGLIFSQQLLNITALERTTVAFVAFCLASSSIYLLNDLMDLEKDKQHPVKRLRPLASGKLPVTWAIIAMGLLVLCCGALTLTLFRIPIIQPDIYASIGGANVLFALSIVAYLLLMVMYSLHLKHVVLIDVFIIASGFVLRTLGGTVAIPVHVSPWLLMVACLLSLFLALGKRRNELVLLQGQASHHRRILEEYSIPMLDQMITVVVAATVMAYSLYTIEGPTGDHRLIITVPCVIYGIFRYLYLVYMKKEGGSPEEVLLRDRHIFATVLICVVAVIAVLYIVPK